MTRRSRKRTISPIFKMYGYTGEFLDIQTHQTERMVTL